MYILFFPLYLLNSSETPFVSLNLMHSMKLNGTSLLLKYQYTEQWALVIGLCCGFLLYRMWRYVSVNAQTKAVKLMINLNFP